MNRRNFFSMLAGLLPFVGSWIAPKPTKWWKSADEMISDLEEEVVFQKGLMEECNRLSAMTFRSVNDENRRLREEIADLHATLEVIEKNHIEWISVKERLPECDKPWRCRQRDGTVPVVRMESRTVLVAYADYPKAETHMGRLSQS